VSILTLFLRTTDFAFEPGSHRTDDVLVRLRTEKGGRNPNEASRILAVGCVGQSPPARAECR